MKVRLFGKTASRQYEGVSETEFFFSLLGGMEEMQEAAHVVGIMLANALYAEIVKRQGIIQHLPAVSLPKIEDDGTGSDLVLEVTYVIFEDVSVPEIVARTLRRLAVLTGQPFYA